VTAGPGWSLKPFSSLTVPTCPIAHARQYRGEDAVPTWHNRTVTDQHAPDFCVKPTLTGDAVVLRPFDVDTDAAALREMLRDPEAAKLTGSVHGPHDLPPWDDAADARMRDWYGTRNDQPDRLDLAIAAKASGQCVGEAVLNEWNDGNRSCNFRIMIGPRGRDRGFGTEATRLTVGYGFDHLGLHRIELLVYCFNPRARHVYEKVGFVTEGVLRHALRWADEWVDATVMSILAPEWTRHHGRPGGTGSPA
jgi:RimJ/RimL family protein N-acetyltransferase